MDYIKPSEAAKSFLSAAVTKLNLPILQLLLRGSIPCRLRHDRRSPAGARNWQLCTTAEA